MSWRIERGDCLSLMRGMDDSSVDHIVTDPPYDAKTHAGMRQRSTPGEIDVVQLGFEELSTLAHIREMLRVARRWVIAFCSLEQLGQYALFSGDHWIRAGFWDRVTGMPQMSGDRPAQPGEGIAIMFAGKGRKGWNGGGRHALWRIPRTNCDNHPTEKPVLLMAQLLKDFTNYGDTVLDPYCGSGSTGVAAIRTGRNFIGMEMLDKYADVAVKRLSASHEQKELVFKKRKKPKNLSLFGGADVKEESKEEGPLGGEGSVSGDLLDSGQGEAGASGKGEGKEDDDGRAVLPGDGNQVQPEDLRPEEDRAEDEGPETLGDPFEEVDPNEEPDGETERGW